MKSFHNFAKKHTCCLSIKNVVPFLSNDAYQFIRINFIVLIKILNNCEPDQNPDRLKFVNLQMFSIILNFVLVSLLYIIDSQVLYFTTCIYYFLDSVHRYKKRKTTFIFINIF